MLIPRPSCCAFLYTCMSLITHSYNYCYSQTYCVCICMYSDRVHVQHWGGWVQGVVVRAAGRMFSWCSDYAFTPPVLWNHLVGMSPSQTTTLSWKLHYKMHNTCQMLQKALDGSCLVHLMGKVFRFLAAVWNFCSCNGPIAPALEKLLTASPTLWPGWLEVWVCSVMNRTRTNMVFSHILASSCSWRVVMNCYSLWCKRQISWWWIWKAQHSETIGGYSSIQP